MGVRLYPNGPEEFLAGVTEGTSKTLDELEARQPKFDGPEMDKWYEELFADSDLIALHNFRMSGFGKLTAEVFTYIKYFNWDENAGHTNDPVHVKNILNLQFLTREDIGTYKKSLITEISWS